MKQYQRYVFIGTYAEMDGRIFNQIGQYSDWDEETYRDRVISAPFIPNKEFSSCGFTPAELIEYGTAANIAMAGESFKAKHLKARIILHEIREGMKARPQEPLPEPTKEEEKILDEGEPEEANTLPETVSEGEITEEV